MPKPSPELAALFKPVLEWLDNDCPGHKLDMAHHYCGIAGALGIFNPQLFEADDDERHRAYHVEDLLVDQHGLNYGDMELLFYGNMSLTPPQAAQMIRTWIRTGEVFF